MSKLNLKKLFLVVAVFVSLFTLLPLEYDDFKVKTILYPLLWISIPIIVFKMLPKKSSDVKNAVLIIGVTLYLLMTILFGLAFFGICAWTNNITLYKSKRDKSIKIVSRRYSCYGTKDDEVLFKERQLTKHVKWVTEFNESQIDTNKWQQIEYGFEE